MKNLPRPVRLEIEIDEWQAAQKKVDAVQILVVWRDARKDPALEALLSEMPVAEKFVPIELVGGRTELAPEEWKHLRFGKGPPIFESARTHFDAWGKVWMDGSPLTHARKYATDLILRYVPNFHDLSDKEQIDLLIRTQEKLNKVRDSAEDLIQHLEYATPKNKKATAPLKNPSHNVRAAVFMDVMGSSRRAGELLGVPLPTSDKDRHENQTVRQRAKLGRELLHQHFGKAGWEAMAARIREHLGWWDYFNAIEGEKEQVYALVAKARGTSAADERRRAEGDGFSALLDEWIPIVERRLEAEAVHDKLRDQHEGITEQLEDARLAVNRAVDKQFAFQEIDERFRVAFSVFKSPPPQP